MHTKLNIHKHNQIMEDFEVGRDVKKRFCCRKIYNLKVLYVAIIVTAPHKVTCVPQRVINLG